MSALQTSWAMLPAFSFVGAMLGCAVILRVLLGTGAAARLATDIPNHRSLHTAPIPRVGGWGVVPASVAIILLSAPTVLPIAVAALLLALVSHLDDRAGLPARVRFAAHCAAAIALVVWLAPYGLPWWLPVPAVLGLVWVVNLFNFMDGADGLAGGMALIGFGAYAAAAWHSAPELARAALALSGAAAGFLLFNFHPARLFLGDAGSIPLGFFAGGLGYWGWRHGVWPFWFAPAVFAPFIADATITLMRRLARGEKFWQAHREHYYQRMIRMGAGHARTALAWYVLMAGGALLSLVARHARMSLQVAEIVLWVLLLLLCGWHVDRRWARFNQSKVSQ